MKRQKILLLCILLICANAYSKSRLKDVDIQIQNQTSDTWQLQGNPVVSPGSIKSKISSYKTIPAGSGVYIHAAGTGNKTNSPHFRSKFVYISGGKTFTLNVNAEGSTQVDVYSSNHLGARIRQLSENCRTRCSRVMPGSGCIGWTYHTCSTTLAIINPPIITLTFSGNYDPINLAAWSSEIKANFPSLARSCIDPNTISNYLNYKNDTQNHRVIFTIKTPC